jgi:8-amino-7-oxononanoate synthase
LITGNLRCHRELEDELAAFCGTEAALVFASGYAINTGLIPALLGPEDVIVVDQLVHASIIDGARLSRAEIAIVPHADLEAFAQTLQDVRAHKRRVLVAVDGLYSMDGDLAPLAEIANLCERHGAMLLVDDAHGTGTLGARGRGTVELAGVLDRVDFLVGTLGKSLGSFGAFVACSKRVREMLINRARSFVFSCALAPAPVEAARAALRVVEAEPERRIKLQANAAFLRDKLAELGISSAPSTTHVIPVVLAGNELTMATTEALLARGIFVQGIRHPSVPRGSERLRVTPMCSHSFEQLAHFATSLREFLDHARATGRSPSA